MDRPLIPRPAYRPGQPLRMEIIDDATAAIYRRMTPMERVARGLNAWRFAQTMVEASVRSQHPEWSEDRLREEIDRRMRGA